MEYAFSTQVHTFSVLCVRQIIWFSDLEERVCVIWCAFCPERMCCNFELHEHAAAFLPYTSSGREPCWINKKRFVVHPNADIFVSARAILMTLHSP